MTIEQRVAVLEEIFAKLQDYYMSDYSGEEIDERLTAAHNAVRYDAAQSLTDAQKTQARANIAAAPDGFGLGANGYPNPYTVVTGATIDTLNESGLFWYRDTDTPIYPDGYNSGTAGNLLNVAGNRENTLASRQIFYPYLPYGGVALGISCMRVQTSSGEWQPWEWVNPPMQLGVEYRTTERYLGKPVYVKVVDCGNLPASGLKNITHGIANCKPIYVYGEMSNGNTLPYTVGATYSISADGAYIQIYVTGDLSQHTVKATIKYTKTTG